MNFEFATATRIIFGPGSAQKLGALASEMGWQALVVTGLDIIRTQPLLEGLASAGVITTLYPVTSEPTIQSVEAGIALAKENNCDLVIAVGGGSAIDAGKAIAALITNPGEALDYLEVVGRNQPLEKAPLPFIAVPTTAGTGAEVTRNAVLSVPEQRLKVSLRSPLMLPRLALIDPQLTHSLPREVTAFTGLDALTQLIEAFTSNRANPMTDVLCREGMARVGRSPLRAFMNGEDAAAREDMSLASLFGGLGLANARLGAVHGFAGALGGMFPAPHGAICARLLPLVVEANLNAMTERDASNPAMERYIEASRILSSWRDATIFDLTTWLISLCDALMVPPLSTYGVTSADIPILVEKSARSSSMQGNPLPLTEAEMRAILEQAL